jgi:hypothetical protein
VTLEHAPCGDRLVCDTPDCACSFGRPPQHWLGLDELREQARQNWWTCGLGLDWCPVHARRMWAEAG